LIKSSCLAGLRILHPGLLNIVKLIMQIIAFLCNTPSGGKSLIHHCARNVTDVASEVFS